MEDLTRLVVIGGSAGSLAGIKGILQGLPTDGGIGYLVIQHLSPDRHSLLASLAAEWSALPVAAVAEGMRLEPDRIHLCVPGQGISIRDGALHLASPRSEEERFRPIDSFCRSISGMPGDGLALVILSGTGRDGVAAAEAIRRVGGLVLAQDPAEAEFDGMPLQVIRAGLADRVSKVVEIPGALSAWAQDKRPASQPVERAGEGVTGPSEEEAYQAILQLVRERTRTLVGLVVESGAPIDQPKVVRRKQVHKPPGDRARMGGLAAAAQLSYDRFARRCRSGDADEIQGEIVDQPEISAANPDRKMLRQVAV